MFYKEGDQGDIYRNTFVVAYPNSSLLFRLSSPCPQLKLKNGTSIVIGMTLRQGSFSNLTKLTFWILTIYPVVGTTSIEFHVHRSPKFVDFRRMFQLRAAVLFLTEGRLVLSLFEALFTHAGRALLFGRVENFTFVIDLTSHFALCQLIKWTYKPTELFKSSRYKFGIRVCEITPSI